LNEIQFKLNEMTKIDENLKITNEFRTNVSLFNQEETCIFGINQLIQYSSKNSLKSEILTYEKQCLDLIKLCEFSPNDKWSLLYRGTRDCFSTKDFHSKCDDHPNTLTILKAKQSSYIFGGFTSVAWDRSFFYKPDPNAFLFSLTNMDNRPLKMKVDPKRHENAIYCASGCGIWSHILWRSTYKKIMQILNMKVVMIWVVLIRILNMKKEQMKLKHFWLAHFVFNWTKLKFIKKNKT
jgi:hypothetical protein